MTITYTGVSELPQDHVIINEIMYNAAAPDASFVEIHNKSLSTAFDLSNFRLDGAGFIFPEGLPMTAVAKGIGTAVPPKFGTCGSSWSERRS